MSERIIALARSAAPTPGGWDVDAGLSPSEAEQLLAVLELVEAGPWPKLPASDCPVTLCPRSG